jgi:outer membrane protein OmpA-like peptidoglycan-associated protein
LKRFPIQINAGNVRRVAYITGTRRVGRSQAASIFWGLVSAFFAAAACYYYWKDHENETSANVLRDQVLTLQEQRETLNSQKDKLQASISETETELKTREDFLQDKEAKLALEESRLDTAGQLDDSQTQRSRSQAVVVKLFNDTVQKFVKDDTDVELRGGRPVLRVPSSVFFDFGGTTLKPEGKALLTQIVQALNGQMDRFELRLETFTDTDGENGAVDTTPSPTNPEPTGDVPKALKKPAMTSWDLTGARAAALEHFLRDQGGSVPFQNIIVVPRADFQPIVPGTEAHARNRRVAITIAPLPAPFHQPDLLHPPDAKTGKPAAKATPKPETKTAKAATPVAKPASDNEPTTLPIRGTKK